MLFIVCALTTSDDVDLLASYSTREAAEEVASGLCAKLVARTARIDLVFQALTLWEETHPQPGGFGLLRDGEAIGTWTELRDSFRDNLLRSFGIEPHAAERDDEVRTYVVRSVSPG